MCNPEANGFRACAVFVWSMRTSISLLPAILALIPFGLASFAFTTEKMGAGWGQTPVWELQVR